MPSRVNGKESVSAPERRADENEIGTLMVLAGIM